MAAIVRPRSKLVVTVGALALAASGCRFSGFYDGPGKTTAQAATSWLTSQQLSDGSFETAGFAGFETPDAVLAIAENAQAQEKWSGSQALAAVTATTRNGNNPLHAIDDLVDAGATAGQAAKVIVLVARPLGLSPTNFDPDHDGGTTNLAAVVANGKQADGSFGTFNATLYAVLASRKTSTPVTANTVAYLRAAQTVDGSWNYSGDPTDTTPDVDTTALAVQALVAARVSPTDPDLVAARAFLASQYQPTTGAWQSFGSDDPNSTASAVLAITALGYDSTRSCWRDTATPALTGQAYPSPTDWLRAQQDPSGRIVSPNDGFGINTFASSQTIQALRRAWLPIEPAAQQPC